MNLNKSTYPWLLLGLIMFFLVTSCNAPDDSMDEPFVPTHGWILVNNGGVDGVAAAVTDYDGLHRVERPGVFRVSLPETGMSEVSAIHTYRDEPGSEQPIGWLLMIKIAVFPGVMLILYPSELDAVYIGSAFPPSVTVLVLA